MSDLMELLERVKAATGPDRELDIAFCDAFGTNIPYAVIAGVDDGNWLREIGGKYIAIGNHASSGSTNKDRYAPKYSASIDAALALVERKLPGWVVDDLSQNSRLAGDPWGCKLASYYGSAPSKNRSAVSGYDYPTAPLAILAALLSALTSGASS